MSQGLSKCNLAVFFGQAQQKDEAKIKNICLLDSLKHHFKLYRE